jgi:hypothetical protein
MTGDETKDDLKTLAQILNAFQQSALDRTSYEKSIDQVSSEFERLLQQEKLAASKHESRMAASTKAVLHIFFPSKIQTSVIDQIKNASGLTDRQIRSIIRTGILTIDNSGRPVLKDISKQLISVRNGIAYLFILGLFSGVVVSQIIYQPIPTLAYVFYGLGFGLAIGSVAGLVLDRSFRAYPIVDKLEKLTPWLAIT